MELKEPPLPPPTFLAGLAAGIAVAAIAAQLWLAVHLEPLVAWQLELRNLSSLALRSEWRWGVPAGCGALLAGLLVLRVRRPLPYVLVAVLAVVLLVATYEWAMAPFDELASRISE